jgi:hypothetical protein
VRELGAFLQPCFGLPIPLRKENSMRVSTKA